MSSAVAVHIAASRTLLPGGQWSGPATLTLQDGRIAAVSAGELPHAEALAGGALTPGLLDLHNNGAFGVDFADTDGPGWARALHGLASRGVTAVQPTVITAPLPGLLASLAGVAAAAAACSGHPVARILGAHLEGPFLSPLHRGAHRADWLLDPNTPAFDALLANPAFPIVRTLTMAPELPGGLDAIGRLCAAEIVVSVGHSDADARQTMAAAGAGAGMVTHLFNAMRPFKHRDPGLPGVALTDSRLWCCLIADGQHVDPVACRLAFQAAAERIVLVTDSILVAGLPPGTPFVFGGMPVMADATGIGRRPDGTISGAGIVLDEGVRRMIAAGIDSALVLRAATEGPARALGRDDLGRIVPGALADLVWWDDDWVPRRVWVGGVEVQLG